MNKIFVKEVNLESEKEMFEFCKNHFTYFTMNSWNQTKSIANNVKVHKLQLEGDEFLALHLLDKDEYRGINDIIREFEISHPNYQIGSNGRSSGYMVLYNKDNTRSVVPSFIADNDNYEDYKLYCKEYGGSYKHELQTFTKLICDFDKCCEEMREHTNELSKTNYSQLVLENAVENFNDCNEKDLANLHIKPLTIKNGRVDLREIAKYNILLKDFKEYFTDLYGNYKLVINEKGLTAKVVDPDKVKVKEQEFGR